ncbi:MAG: hypothetical protein H0U08_02005 [Actinobacteria bacterium]|nr:hypothetical protein [Actinomycetota bacterium]
MIPLALGRWGRRAAWAAAVLAIPIALALAVVATDALRTPAELRADDARFESAPMRQRNLWKVGFLPGLASERLLGLEDDVFHRQILGLYLRVEPGEVDYEGFPELESLRAKAQYEVTRLSREDPDPRRRSRLLTMYGVITLDTRARTDEEREDNIRRAVSAFRNAIELDPENDDAKTNLEGVLSREGPVVFGAANAPTSDRAGGRKSGQGTRGSGY